jgi:hypothetical protein
MGLFSENNTPPTMIRIEPFATLLASPFLNAHSLTPYRLLIHYLAFLCTAFDFFTPRQLASRSTPVLSSGKTLYEVLA